MLWATAWAARSTRTRSAGASARRCSTPRAAGSVATFACPPLFLLFATVAACLKQVSMLTSTATRQRDLPLVHQARLDDRQHRRHHRQGRGADRRRRPARHDRRHRHLALGGRGRARPRRRGREPRAARGVARALVVYAGLCACDIMAIYREIRAVVFKRLNHERAHFVIAHHLAAPPSARAAAARRRARSRPPTRRGTSASSGARARSPSPRPSRRSRARARAPGRRARARVAGRRREVPARRGRRRRRRARACSTARALDRRAAQPRRAALPPPPARRARARARRAVGARARARARRAARRARVRDGRAAAAAAARADAPPAAGDDGAALGPLALLGDIEAAYAEAQAKLPGLLDAHRDAGWSTESLCSVASRAAAVADPRRARQAATPVGTRGPGSRVARAPGRAATGAGP